MIVESLASSDDVSAFNHECTSSSIFHSLCVSILNSKPIKPYFYYECREDEPFALLKESLVE